MLGFNAFSKQTSWPLCSPTVEIMRKLKLPPNQMQKLLGNGWHMAVVASWLCYLLARTVKLNRNMSIQPELTLLKKGGSGFSSCRKGSGLSRAASSQSENRW